MAIKLFQEREIVSRKKIGKMIEKFTEGADPNQPICIFAGDINFFGDVSKVIKNADKRTRKKNKNENIEYNSQYKQLERLKCRNICILCIKPLSQDDDSDNRYQGDRIRIGYLASKFDNVIHFRFIDDKSNNCCSWDQTDCTLLMCNQCQPGDSCPRRHINSLYSLPDTTLRGRIVTNRETGAKCVAITTKKSSGKDYILRQYGAGEKECSLYDVIWKVWWKECPEDINFINACKTEYCTFINVQGEST